MNWMSPTVTSGMRRAAALQYESREKALQRQLEQVDDDPGPGRMLRRVLEGLETREVDGGLDLGRVAANVPSG